MIQTTASKICSSGSVTISSTKRLHDVEGHLADALHAQAVDDAVDAIERDEAARATLALHRRARRTTRRR